MCVAFDTQNSRSSNPTPQSALNARRCTLQVQRLQRELGDAHAADYNTLKRAYVSLVQHFRALQIEAQARGLLFSRMPPALFVSRGHCAQQQDTHVTATP